MERDNGCCAHNRCVDFDFFCNGSKMPGETCDFDSECQSNFCKYHRCDLPQEKGILEQVTDAILKIVAVLILLVAV